MANPLLDLTSRPWSRRGLRRVAVPVPTEEPSTDAVFLVLRRMRMPLVLLVVVFSVSVAGLMAIPGVDDKGHAYRMSAFDAFYVISYTATTIGFGEIPYAFTGAQRMWLTVSIYASVVGWAFSIGTLFALLQDSAFQEAVARQRVARRVRRMHEPFHIVAGYGNAGRLVCRVLDETGHRVSVLDASKARIDRLETDQLAAEAPGIEADVSRPTMLGLAGLGHPQCAGVLALTEDDDANLNVVMAAHLLRPELPIIARCADRASAQHMLDFTPDAVINPYDRYGEYLALALRKPSVFRFFTWMVGEPGSMLPPLREHLRDGRWVVCADDHFGQEVAADLRDIGLQVEVVDPRQGDPDLDGVTGLVAGTSSDTLNLATSAHARRLSSEVFLSVRQESHVTASLLTAFDFDSVFVPTQLVAREVLARVVTPVFWQFVEHVAAQSDDWAVDQLERIVQRVGQEQPQFLRIDLDRRHAPAVQRWLRTHELRLGDLLRCPDEREQVVPVITLALLRDGEALVMPDEDELLRQGDALLVGASGVGLRELSAALFYDATLTYVATGRVVPATWLWRMLTNRRALPEKATERAR